ELFPRLRSFAETPEHPVRPRTRALLDREIRLPVVLLSLPFDEWQSRRPRFCSTSDLAGAQGCLGKPAAPRRALSVFLPNGAHGALLPRPCAKECLCAFRRVRAQPDLDRFVRSLLPPASCALRLQ